MVELGLGTGSGLNFRMSTSCYTMENQTVISAWTETPHLIIPSGRVRFGVPNRLMRAQGFGTSTQSLCLVPGDATSPAPRP